MLSKNVNNKCVPNLVFFNEKKLRKIPMIFDIEIDFESQILALFDTSPLHQFFFQKVQNKNGRKEMLLDKGIHFSTFNFQTSS